MEVIEMNKTKLGIFIALILSIGIISAGMVSAKGAEITQIKVLDLGKEVRLPSQANSLANEENRMIVQTTSGMDKLIFRLKGCKILHELNDATAIKCPKGIAIKGAKPDRIFHMHDLEADVQINADDVWNMPPIGYDGSGVKVAILDTGVDTTHIELSGSVLTTKNFIKRGTSYDEYGHGTHVSGIVTANGLYMIDKPDDNRPPNRATGVAHGADIIVGKVCGPLGCFESDIIAGIEWAVAEDAKVLSLSLGGGNYDGYCDKDRLAKKVNWAVSQGLVVTVSAGNEGAGVSSPACASEAIAVGAVDKTDVRPSWSNYGSALDLVAPGVDILSTYSCVAAGDCGSYRYAWMSGTSMSAPHVAGTAALILQKNPGYTVDEVKEALYSTAVDLGTGGYDQYYGHGRVDAYAAVTYTPLCSSNEDCDDGNDCTTDTCIEGVCSNTEVQDNTACGAGGICCGGTCTVATCSIKIDCDDSEYCTTDTCINTGTCDASCSNAWPVCGLEDGCCGPECSYPSDPDCPSALCGDGICAGQDLGEYCNSCPEDCPSKTHPRKGLLRCCGNYQCEPGENIDNCPVDCSSS